jgi:hypothetical protein
MALTEVLLFEAPKDVEPDGVVLLVLHEVSGHVPERARDMMVLPEQPNLGTLGKYFVNTTGACYE